MDCSVSVGAVMALGTHIITGQKAAAAVCLHGGVLPVWWRVGGEGESVTKVWWSGHLWPLPEWHWGRWHVQGIRLGAADFVL